MKCFVINKSLVEKINKNSHDLILLIFKGFILVRGFFQIIFQTEANKKLFEKLHDKLSLELTGHPKH